MIPERVERRARWVLDSVGARELGFGDDVPYRPEGWAAVDRLERPSGDDLAAAFFDLSRLEERPAPRDEHGRVPSTSSCLDPLHPPLERLRRRLGIPPQRWDGARFAVALTHDVDSPWRWTRVGVRSAAARLKGHAAAGRLGSALREARGLAELPLHKARGTDPNWRFVTICDEERRRDASSTFFVLAGHRDPHDGAAPETYEQLRPRLVETIRSAGGEIGLHGSYTTAITPARLAEERDRLVELAGPVAGHRYHYLHFDPLQHLVAVDRLFRYDTSLGFADGIGFRAGIARPFHPWDFEAERPLDLVEVPLAVMDVTLAEERYLGLSPEAAWPLLERLLDQAADHGAGFAVLWHPDRFDPATSAGWNRLYYRFIEAVAERGGRCMSAGELVETWLNEA